MRSYRKTLLLILVLAGAIMGSAESAPAQTIRIGLINSTTGFAAQVGDEMEKGISLYVKTHEMSCRRA